MSISAAELVAYKHQLKTVQEAIALDPENDELKSLLGDLQEIVAVAENLAKATAKKAPSHSSTEEETPHLYKEGQLCEAYYTGDGLWYPATVTGVSQDGLLYTVKFVDYDEIVNVQAASLRAIDSARREEIEKESRKRVAQEALGGPADGEASKKKKYKDKKANQEKKNEEMNQKQQSWMSFAGKQKQGKSIFASPDTFTGKVGVTGSGKGTTGFAQRKKHEFETKESN